MIRRDFLEELHCPYCSSPFDLEWQIPSGGIEIRHGILRCACYCYPIVDGIVVLRQDDEALEKVVEHLRNGDHTGALHCALSLSLPGTARRTSWQKMVNYTERRHLPFAGVLAMLERQRLERKITANASLPFRQALEYFRPLHYAHYLYHRYANPSFLAAVALLLLFKELVGDLKTFEHAASYDDGQSVNLGVASGELSGIKPRMPASRRRILDLACGVGHSSFLIRHLFPQLAVIAADYDFVNLYLAQRFLNHEVNFVCLDAEAPLPFAENSFDGVFCLDALHYIHSKVALIGELDRVIQPEGLWLFPHLHNALAHNLSAGIPLRPEDYLKCFDFIQPRLLIESEVLSGFTSEQCIDLGAVASEKELQQANAYCLIGSRRNHLWHNHCGLATLLAQDRSSLTFNTIYRVTGQRHKICLEMRWPSARMEEECGAIRKYIPQQHEIAASLLSHLKNGNKTEEDTARLEELVKSFVLVQLPRGYVFSSAV